MFKKISVTALAALMLTGSAFAADTMLEKTDAMEVTVYGQVQQGAIVDRAGQLELTLKGHEEGGAIGSIVNRLYNIIEDNGATPTLRTTVDMLQWTYDGTVTHHSMIKKMDSLERAILGRVSEEPLETRVKAMSKILLGADKELTFQNATISQTEPFKVKINEPISTEKNSEGDTFTFTVAEDIMDGNLLVVPEGTKGTGVITKLKHARSFGRPAEINLAFNNISTVSGDMFNAEQGKEAKERSKDEMKAAGASVAGVAILGPIGVVGGFFIKGSAIEYPQGQAMFVQPVATVESYGIGLEEVSVPKKKAEKEVKEKDTTVEEQTNTVEEKAKDAATEVKEKNEEVVEVAQTKAEQVSADEEDSSPEEAVVVIKKSE